MRKLFLLRHARAEAGGKDESRPLSSAGLADAERLGRFLGRLGLIPDRILCSTALRTRQTVEALTEGCGCRRETVFLPELYLAETETMLSVIRCNGEAAAALMLVGHNPGLGACAGLLAGDACPDLHATFPTSALALFAANSTTWRDFSSSACRFERFIRRGDIYTEE